MQNQKLLRNKKHLITFLGVDFDCCRWLPSRNVFRSIACTFKWCLTVLWHEWHSLYLSSSCCLWASSSEWKSDCKWIFMSWIIKNNFHVYRTGHYYTVEIFHRCNSQDWLTTRHLVIHVHERTNESEKDKNFLLISMTLPSN